jgi:hypothetical protein
MLPNLSAQFLDSDFPSESLTVRIARLGGGSGQVGVELVAGKSAPTHLDTHTAQQFMTFLNAAIAMAERENYKK